MYGIGEAKALPNYAIKSIQERVIWGQFQANTILVYGG